MEVSDEAQAHLSCKVPFPLELNGKCYLKLSFSHSLESGMIYHGQGKLDTNLIFSIRVQTRRNAVRIPRVAIHGRKGARWD